MRKYRSKSGPAGPAFDSKYGLRFPDVKAKDEAKRAAASAKDPESVANFIESISSRIDDLLAAIALKLPAA